MSFIAWSRVSGRSREIAASLGGEARVFYPRALAGSRLVLLRYLVASAGTAFYLARKRPRAVITTLPPVLPGVLAWLYGLVSGAPFLLDSHPSGFGMKGDRVSQLLMPVHRWLSRRAAATLVTTDDWARVVDVWGGRGLVVHEAPPTWEVTAPKARPATPLQVLFVCVFGPDEPVEEVLEAARLTPQVNVVITGDRARARAGVLADPPPNVSFSGFLGESKYRDAVVAADAVLALTTEPSSVMRAAYEAVYALRPLIATDHEENRRLFPHAVLVGNEALSIHEGFRTVIDEYQELAETVRTARADQCGRWQRQLRELRKATSPASV